MLLLLLPVMAAAQIQIVALPEPGFEKRIQEAVQDIWLIDTHEHLEMEADMVERNRETPLDFTYLYSQYISDDLRSAGYEPTVQQMVVNKSLSYKDRWAIFKPFFEATLNTGYGRVPVIVARDLFGVHEWHHETIEELSDKIHKANQPGWYKTVLKDKARIELSILDVGHIRPDPEFYVHVERFDHFIHVFSAATLTDLGRQYKIEVTVLEDFVSTLNASFQEGLDYGMVGVKSALAYSRPIEYPYVSEGKAESVFNQMMNSESALSFEEAKPLQDYMMHRVLDLAQKHALPIQIHTGLHAGGKNEIRNSKPTLLTNLFNEYPDVNFIIFHSSYPYGVELSVLAKNYPNVFIDMCWTQVISPCYSERYLHEWLETVPANKIMAFGGDYGQVENVYGHAVMARKVVTKVLTEKVASGYITEAHAIAIANKLLRTNALEIFKLKGYSRGLESLPELSKKGDAYDLWEQVKSGSGIIRNWKVIGPFPIGTGHFTAEAPPGFDEVYPPEEEIDFSKTYNQEGRTVKWQTLRTEKSGILDFKQLFPEGKAIVYAYTELISPEKKKMTFSFGSDDGAKVWINSKLVYREHAWRGLSHDSDFIHTTLKKGKNRILVKVEDKWMNWEMMMRMIDVDDEVEVVTW